MLCDGRHECGIREVTSQCHFDLLMAPISPPKALAAARISSAYCLVYFDNN